MRATRFGLRRHGNATAGGRLFSRVCHFPAWHQPPSLIAETAHFWYGISWANNQLFFPPGTDLAKVKMTYTGTRNRRVMILLRKKVE